jgi:hypothetical protein
MGGFWCGGCTINESNEPKVNIIRIDEKLFMKGVMPAVEPASSRGFRTVLRINNVRLEGPRWCVPTLMWLLAGRIEGRVAYIHATG